MARHRWEYAEFGYGGSGETDIREVWFSHRETWSQRPVDPSLTLRELGELGFELVTLLRYPKRFEAELLYRKGRLTMRMTATSTFYMFKRPLEEVGEEPAEDQAERETGQREGGEREAGAAGEGAPVVGRASDY